MPCLEVTLPRQEESTRVRLAEALTTAFAESTGLPADIFEIRFQQCDEGEFARGGKLITQRERACPYLHLVLYCGRMPRRVKQAIAGRMTAAITETLGEPNWKPIIHIQEHPYDNVVVDGELLSDAFPDGCRSDGFYYPLPDR